MLKALWIVVLVSAIASPALADNRNHDPDKNLESVNECQEDPDCAALSRRLDRKEAERNRAYAERSDGEKLLRGVIGIAVFGGALWAFYGFLFGVSGMGGSSPPPSPAPHSPRKETPP